MSIPQSHVTFAKVEKLASSTRRRIVVRKINKQDVPVIEDTASEPEDDCPVIKANQVMFTGEASGRLRVVFF